MYFQNENKNLIFWKSFRDVSGSNFFTDIFYDKEKGVFERKEAQASKSKKEEVVAMRESVLEIKRLREREGVLRELHHEGKWLRLIEDYPRRKSLAWAG